MLMKLFAIIGIILITVWITLTSPILTIISVISTLIKDFNNPESKINVYANSMVIWTIELMTLPYKVLGVCKNFKEYLTWLQINS